MDIQDLDTAVLAYVECALWAGLDISRSDKSGNNPPLDENYDIYDVTADARDTITNELRAFITDNESDVASLDAEQVGHDFYLTRNGHGAGFWDRGLGDIGERLSDSARAYGSSELYPDDNGKLAL